MNAVLGIPASRWARAGAILVGAAIIAWVAQASTISTVLGARRLETTLAWWPTGAEGLAAAAANQLSATPRTPAGMAQAESFAMRALRRDPTSVIAARTLGLSLVDRRDRAGGDALLSYAESLSRRDLPTQLFFIEASVQRNDIAGALLHYDRALRTSPRARDILLPILVQAATDATISGPLAELLSQRPPWWPFFMDRLVADGTSPEALAHMILALRLDPADPDERADLDHALNRLVGLGAFPTAGSLYLRFGPPRLAPGEFVRNGGFESNAGFGPFDWALTDQPDLAGVKRAGDGGTGRFSLALISSNGRSGDAARQLLLIPPGHFRLALRAGGVAGDPIARPNIRILCANDAHDVLLEFRVPPMPRQGGNLSTAFTVPAAQCPAQWLALQAGAGLDTQPETPWIDDVSIVAA